MISRPPATQTSFQRKKGVPRRSWTICTLELCPLDSRVREAVVKRESSISEAAHAPPEGSPALAGAAGAT